MSTAQPDGLYRGSTFLGNETDTGLRTDGGEHWLVPCDRGGGGIFDEWLADQQAKYPWRLRPGTIRLLRDAWTASRNRHTASLRRIGWLDGHGRVWLELPDDTAASAFTPLLVDVREDSP